MKKHSPAVLAAALLLGFLLPFLTSALQDRYPLQTEWPLPKTDSHYTYQGTLLNRVIALNTYQNTSQAVRELHRHESPASSALWNGLNRFLPIEGLPSVSYSEAFTLAPASYSAEYHYLEADFSQENLILHMIVDAETQLPLRIELTCPPETLTDYLAQHDLWEILHGYVSLLSLGEAADGDTQISSILHSQTAQIRGTSFKATATVMPAYGTLLLKLTSGIS